MQFCEAIKKLRQHLLLSQEAFGKEIGVTFATVNRWETGKTLPNYKALKQIEELCKKHNIEHWVNVETFERSRKYCPSFAIAPIVLPSFSMSPKLYVLPAPN